MTNTGDRKGTEVVRAEVDDELSSVTRPQNPTQGFARIALEPGQSARVSIELGWHALRLLNRKMQWEVEPGRFQIRLATSTASIDTGGLTVEA